MKISCPRCQTLYQVDADALLAVDGLARCFRCGTVFDALDEDSEPLDSAVRRHFHALTLEDQADLPAPADDEPRDLPFEVPADLAPLQPTGDGALDVLDTLYEKKSRRGLLYGLFVLLLMLALGAQLAWRYRAELLQRYPLLEPVCQYLACRPGMIRAPEMFRVVQRDIKPTPQEPGSLTLNLRFRNTAELAQPLPDIQLSLLDNNGSVLIRRRLAPREYLFPAPPEGTLVTAGEVVTIELDFKDPGYLATGFTIDFL